MTKEQIAIAIAEWTRDEAAQVGPERVLIGNNFDMLADRIMALQPEADQRDAARYKERRWQAYALGRTGGDSIEYAAFAAQYDAVSDAAVARGRK